MNKTIKLTPSDGNVYMDKRTRKTYKEVVCAEVDKHFFIEVKAEQ